MLHLLSASLLSVFAGCVTPDPIKYDSQPVVSDDSTALEDSPVETIPGGDDSVPEESVGDSTAEDSETTADPCGEIPADEAAYADLFDTTRIHTFAITLGDAEKAALEADPGTYVIGDVLVDGTAFTGVGIKWRGVSTEQRWDGKPGFKIGLRSGEECGSYAGMSRFTLDAMDEDPAQGRLVVASAVFAAAGLPISAATYASVSVNGEAFGLYTHLETVDGSFVARRWPGEMGVLWEGQGEADFTGRSVGDWTDVDSSGDEETLEAIATVVATSGDDFYAQADALVDMPQLLSTWAMLAAVGHRGSFPYDTGDVYAYAEPVDGRLSFVPWDVGAGWDTTFGWNYVDSALGLRCVYDPTCSAALREAIDAALVATDTLDVPTLAAATWLVSTDALGSDTRRGTTAGDVMQARGILLGTMAGWTAGVRAQMGE